MCLIASVGAALLVLAAATAPAAASERARDGGFETTTCETDKASCVNPHWAESGTQAFVCKTPTCAAGPKTGAGFLVLGSDPIPGPDVGPALVETGAVTQAVPVPAEPASLSFQLAYETSDISGLTTTLAVKLDEIVVYTTTRSSFDTPSAPYAPVTVDVSHLTSGGVHQLTFDYSCRYSDVGATTPVPCDTYRIDDVAVDAADRPGDFTPLERLTDGGFESTQCPTDLFSCTNPFWTESGTQSFLCASNKCDPAVTPASGTHFLVLGSDFLGPRNDGAALSETGALTQSFEMPGTPATLSFKLRAAQYGPPNAPSSLTVSLDGTSVFELSRAEFASYGSYATVTRDVSSLSGPGSHTLSFALTCSLPSSGAGQTYACDRFDIDEVSLLASTAVSPTPPTDPPADPGPPGQAELDTTITKRPKAKTRSKQAKFEFTSTTAGATFECSLDGKAFKGCVSPRIFKVGKGRHNFLVRALDSTGKADPTPAAHSWKVKRKRKKPKPD